MSEKRTDGQLVNLDEDEPVGKRAYEAYKLRQRGMRWNDVAAQTGFSGGESARVEVTRLLKSASAQMTREYREQALVMELDRLDSLLIAVWPAAETGDTKAVDSALRIIATRSKLLGLDTLYEQESAGTTKTIVIQGTTEAYTDTLKKIAEEA